MSRSPRRRKDTAWCRGCDAVMVARDGRGRCPLCMERERLARWKAMCTEAGAVPYDWEKR